jgi:flagellar motility protein MotE (MotC chaperone)
MHFKLIVAALAIAAVPALAQAQAPNPPKSSKSAKPAKAAPAAPASKAEAAQKLVKTISADKAKTQTYCDIGKLGDQIEEAEQKKDLKRIDELNRKMDELATKLGPEYVALMSDLQDIDPSSKEAQDISSTLEGLDKLCAK